MRVWIDITNSPHVTFFRPLIRLLEEDSHQVEVTARAFAQIEQLLRSARHRRDDRRHSRRAGRGTASRERWPDACGNYASWARGRNLRCRAGRTARTTYTLTARGLRIPSTTTFDYEFALAQHHFGTRAATRVVVPEAIPPERLRPYGLRPPKLARYPGLKEEYYLADFEPDPRSPGRAGRRCVSVSSSSSGRLPTLRSTTARGNPLFPRTLELLGRRDDVHAVVCRAPPSNVRTSGRSHCRR